MTRDENPYTPPTDDPASREKQKGHQNLVGLIVSVVVVLVAPFVGAMVSAFSLIWAFQGTERVDPSQKAQVLGDGISRAMNGAAFGLFVSCAALVSTLVFAVRLVRARRRREG
jgi:biopolymer transport protein ExbB/TolQ